MDQNSKAAYIMAQAALLNAEIAGMTAENQYRASFRSGDLLAYNEEDFQRCIAKYSVLLDNNALTFLRD